jgi:hypothetical protein
MALHIVKSATSCSPHYSLQHPLSRHLVLHTDIVIFLAIVTCYLGKRTCAASGWLYNP